MEDHSSLIIGYYKNTCKNLPWEVLPKKKRCGTELTQRVSMEDESSGNGSRGYTNGQAYSGKF